MRITKNPPICRKYCIFFYKHLQQNCIEKINSLTETMQQTLHNLLHQITAKKGQITVLTGAGISAESGIPTFRGPEGYWAVGSKVYHPQEMATFAMFSQMPDEVWKWYLYRMGICRQAIPNAGHYALVQMEKSLLDRFTIITQNVDGLHLRAGNSLARTLQIHGNVDFMRCALECTDEVFPIPAGVAPKGKDDPLSETDRALLRCPKCGAKSRPHVLLFDECYNEQHYHFYSALAVAKKTDLLLVVGTAGATNLPNQVAGEVFRKGGAIVDINVEANPFSQLAEQSANGFFYCSPSASALPQVAKILVQ